jgi:hypothetical protein
MTTGSRRVNLLNQRFRDGTASSNLTRAGVCVHQFDSEEHAAQPWRGCPRGVQAPPNAGGECAIYGGRLSSSVINAEVATASGIRLFSHRGGVVFDPVGLELNCVYGADSGSRNYAETGCNPDFCQSPSDAWCNGLPHRPDPGLELVLRSQVGADRYNEVMVNAGHLDSRLPRAIEAIFALHPDAGGSAQDLDVALRVHGAFLETFPLLSAAGWPLLVLNSHDTTHPFSVHRG